METTDLIVPEQSLTKPFEDTQYAHAAAKQLMAIVKQNGWARKLGGQSEHLQVEAWLTVGKYYHLAVDTDSEPVEYVEYGGVWGFKAHAKVIDTTTGNKVGGASALCMSDENNWATKPKFQLASMAQTRATSKALRQVLSFVVALAGFNPTPAEEMTETVPFNNTPETPMDGEILSEDNACANCGEIVKSEKVREFSMDKYGKILCMKCQKLES